MATHLSLWIFAGLSLLWTCLTLVLTAGPLAAQSGLPRVSPSDLTYLGAFRLPDNGLDNVGAEYDTGSTLVYNAAQNSLFITCNIVGQEVAEITIPGSLGTGSTVASLPAATLRRGCADPRAGASTSFCTGSCDQPMTGSVLPYNGKLYSTQFVGYLTDAGDLNGSHFYKDTLDLATSNAHGVYPVSGMPNMGYLNSYMFTIPTAWQSSFSGKTVFIGNCCISGVGLMSTGPAIAAWNPEDLPSASSAIPALYYQDAGHNTIGVWNETVSATYADANGNEDTATLFGCGLGTSGPASCGGGLKIWSNAAGVNSFGFRSGMAIDGTRSVLFWGTQGVGEFCYGEPGVECPAGSDPDIPFVKGLHAYPYYFTILAYDLNDLAAVAAGTISPWVPVPYSAWFWTPHFGSANHATMFGASWDPATRRVYVFRPYLDTSTSPEQGIIEVWSIANLETGDTLAPAAPTQLRVTSP